MKLVLSGVVALGAALGIYKAAAHVVDKRADRAREQDAKDYMAESNVTTGLLPVAVSWITAVAKINNICDRLNIDPVKFKPLATKAEWLEYSEEWNNGTGYFDPLVRSIKQAAPNRLYIGNTTGKNNRLVFILSGAENEPNQVWFQRYSDNYNVWVCQHNQKVGPMTFAQVIDAITTAVVTK
jgi:hypothetical protein